MAGRSLNLVVVNWRDIRSPYAGGAEIHLHEILTRMVARGHRATLVVSSYPQAPAEGVVDGLRVIRRGSWWNANFAVAAAAARVLKREPADLVVDDINKIPFLMPWRTRVPVLAVVPHLFGATVFRETNPLFAAYVWAWELLIPRAYRHSRFAVISPSTRDDLVRRGIAPERIDVVLCGLDHSLYRRVAGVERNAAPTLVHFGRVRKYKAIDVVLRALVRVRESLPDARLVVVGDGPELPALKRLAVRLGIGDAVLFTGRLGPREIVEMLNRCHVFLNASPKEGWGLTVVEANACGLPVVGSDRPGLRDSIRHGETGFLVPYGDADAFAARALELLQDAALWERMSRAAVEWAGSLTWERTADEMERAFHRALAEAKA